MGHDRRSYAAEINQLINKNSLTLNITWHKSVQVWTDLRRCSAGRAYRSPWESRNVKAVAVSFLLAERPNAQAWWQAVKSRPSYAEARVGPSGEEIEVMAIEGAKVVGDFEKKRAEYLAQYGQE